MEKTKSKKNRRITVTSMATRMFFSLRIRSETSSYQRSQSNYRKTK